MNEQHESHPEDERKQANELLQSLELFRLNPQLESILESIADAQEGFAGLTTNEAHAVLRRLNEVLETTK